jgi:hypothetical protein
MHGRSDRSGKSDDSIYRKWGIGFLVLPLVLAGALFALSILQPPTSNWIAEIVSAEFSGISLVPKQTPREQVPMVQPGTQLHTVRAD